MDELKKKLKEEIESCDWSMLEAHHEREALLLVEGEIPLIDAAMALAKDNVELVKYWQSKNFFRRPTEEEIKSWSEDKFNKMARFLIIQPFVLIQLLN